jgi:hypothetical protein
MNSLVISMARLASILASHWVQETEAAAATGTWHASHKRRMPSRNTTVKSRALLP